MLGASPSGSPLHPIHVQIAPPPPSAAAFKFFRYIIGMALLGFFLLTIMSLVLESTGLLKVSTGPAEFEPEEGKMVKFSDVHGVEEAKAVGVIDGQWGIMLTRVGIGRGRRIPA
jgi:ATP-dependent metalloprotease